MVTDVYDMWSTNIKAKIYVQQNNDAQTCGEGK